MKRFFHSRKIILILVVAHLLGALLLSTFLPASLERRLAGVCLVESRSRYAVAVSDGDTLFFAAEVAERPSEGLEDFADTAATTRLMSGFFISEDGCVMTTGDLLGAAPDTLSATPLRRLLERERERLNRLRDHCKKEQKELDYYAHTHSVTDEGYNAVMDLGRQTDERRARLDTLLDRVDKLLKKPALSAVRQDLFRVIYRLATDSGGVSSAVLPATFAARGDSSLLLLRLCGERLPRGAYAFSPSLFPAFGPLDRRFPPLLFGFQSHFVTTDTTVALLPDVVRLTSDVPQLPMAQGGPVTDVLGRLTGVKTAGGRADVAAIRRLCYGYRNVVATFAANVTARAKRLFTRGEVETSTFVKTGVAARRNIASRYKTGKNFGTLRLDSAVYSGGLRNGVREGQGEMRYPDGSVYRGAWKNGRREGRGEFLSVKGRRYEGFWRADTLPEGVCRDSAGVYRGHMNARLEFEGTGARRDTTGTLYRGFWHEDKPEGFGFAVGPWGIVKCGTWKKGRFLGEQMIYTANRVYGIDISRYQHEKGRRKFPFNWDKLRIRSLGPAGNRHVKGTPDYEVAFVFIKASQGTTIRNRYYANDAAQARRRGIPIGAYHFFSMKPGKAQADFFLKTARPRKGDLPPVLDVELTDRQIEQMGGEAALFREMLVWMRTVEHACGTKPILYVSQQFVNRHIPNAPPAIRDYDVWIARYGQYRPYVHLLVWQLTDNGRVDGIQTPVDINVFNGTKARFDDYRRRAAVK